MNITIPEAMRKRMASVRGVNWSEVARAAFERKLAQLEVQKDEPKMEDVVARLLATREESVERDEAEGKKLGRSWAMKTATMKELEALEDWAKIKWNNRVIPEACGELATLYMNIVGWNDEKDGQPDTAVVEEWWRHEVNGRGYEPSEAMLDGFMEGVIEIWREVQQRL